MQEQCVKAQGAAAEEAYIPPPTPPPQPTAGLLLGHPQHGLLHICDGETLDAPKAALSGGTAAASSTLHQRSAV